jgi:hypothetical protein
MGATTGVRSMSQELVNKLNKQVEQHIHGQGKEDILAQLEAAPTADTVAKITYDLIVLMAQQAESRGAGLEIEVLMGVATETIDILIEIMEAMGAPIEGQDEVREEALIKALILHMEAVEDDPEEKAAAQELLAQLMEDGTMDETMNHINSKASASPEQMQQAGAAMVQPQQKPLAAGVQRGLMG